MGLKVGDEIIIKGKITKKEEDTQEINVEFQYGYSMWLPDCISTVEKTYEQGLSDAWELAKKIVCHEEQGGMSIPCFSAIFDEYMTVEEVLASLTAEEALAKIEAYEKEKEIKVGDIVTIDSVKGMAVVTNVGEGSVNVMWDDGIAGNCETNRLKKTGKHIEIESLLRQIGE